MFAYIPFCDVSHFSYYNFYHNLSPLCDRVEGTEWFQNLGIFTLGELLGIDKNYNGEIFITAIKSVQKPVC